MTLSCVPAGCLMTELAKLSCPRLPVGWKPSKVRPELTFSRAGPPAGNLDPYINSRSFESCIESHILVKGKDSSSLWIKSQKNLGLFFFFLDIKW